MSERVTRQDWCDAGLALLRDEGIPALTIERLCTALQRTKGSFYHHFRHLDDYLDMLFERWEQKTTAEPIDAVGAEADPFHRGKRLDETVARLDHRLDRAVRAWALWDERARAAVERVDARRIAYLAELNRARGEADSEGAALLEYATFVGAQALGVFADPERAARLKQHIDRGRAQLAADPDSRPAPRPRKSSDSKASPAPRRRNARK